MLDVKGEVNSIYDTLQVYTCMQPTVGVQLVVDKK